MRHVALVGGPLVEELDLLRHAHHSCWCRRACAHRALHRTLLRDFQPRQRRQRLRKAPLRPPLALAAALTGLRGRCGITLAVRFVSCVCVRAHGRRGRCVAVALIIHVAVDVDLPLVRHGPLALTRGCLLADSIGGLITLQIKRRTSSVCLPAIRIDLPPNTHRSLALASGCMCAAGNACLVALAIERRASCVCLPAIDIRLPL
mmetsp:Transcript_18228/g.44758  ORF Transcript_18228/g.44758 Transcript_18228/m.44758 type:complete len:204 (+) Transcript_18228:342-953(+)